MDKLKGMEYLGIVFVLCLVAWLSYDTGYTKARNISYEKNTEYVDRVVYIGDKKITFCPPHPPSILDKYKDK